MEKNKNAGFLHLRLGALFCLVTIMLIVLGVLYYGYEAQLIKEDKYEDISVIAGLKADSIKEWRRRALADVHRVPGPLVKKEMVRFLQNPTNPGTRKTLQTQLNINRKVDIYADALFLDTKGNILLSDNPDPVPVDVATMKAIEAVLKDRKEVLSDFFRDTKGHIYIDAVAPIPDNTGRPIAIVVLRSKAADFLYPLIQSWPTPSKTAETLLVRRDGDSILFLNELRHRSNTALTLRIPLTKTSLPSVQAALGNYGRFHSRDYRGVDTLAVAQPVPESPWFIVAKVDTKEILAEIKYRAWVVSIIVLLLVIILASLIIIIYRNQQEVERKKAVFEIMKSEDRFRAIFELSTVGNSLTAPDGQMLQINKAFADMLGYTIEEIQQTNFMQITHPDDLAKSQECIRRLLADEQTNYQMEKRYIHKNGYIVWANVSTTLLRDEQRMPIYLITSIVDITERKQAVEALKKSEEKFSKVFKASTVPITIASLDECRFIDVNDALLKTTGFSRDKVIGYTVTELNLWADIDDRQKFVEKLSRDGFLKNFETRYKMYDGEIRYFLVSSEIIELEGTKCSLNFIIDITESKRLESQREAVLEEIRILNEELEQRVAQRTAELTAKTADLERINKVFVDRELRMRELKARIAELEKKDE
jgi:PAS domain S-box-containing protein